MSENDERRVLHADFFTEDPEPRLIAGKSKSSGNWTFPPYLADPVSSLDPPNMVEKSSYLRT